MFSRRMVFRSQSTNICYVHFSWGAAASSGLRGSYKVCICSHFKNSSYSSIYASLAFLSLHRYTQVQSLIIGSPLVFFLSIFVFTFSDTEKMAPVDFYLFHKYSSVFSCPLADAPLTPFRLHMLCVPSPHSYRVRSTWPPEWALPVCLRAEWP